MPEIRHWWLVALWNILNKSLGSENLLPFILDKRVAIGVLHCGTRGLSGSLVCNQRCLGNLSPGLGLGSRGILAVSLDLLACPHFAVESSCAACGWAAWWGPCWGWWRAGREEEQAWDGQEPCLMVALPGKWSKEGHLSIKYDNIATHFTRLFLFR